MIVILRDGSKIYVRRHRELGDRFILSSDDVVVNQIEFDDYVETHKSMAGQFSIKYSGWGQVSEILYMMYPCKIKEMISESEDYDIDKDYILADGSDIRKLKFPPDAVF